MSGQEETLPAQPRLVSHSTWEVATNHKEEGVQVHTLHGYRYDDLPAPESYENVFITQAEPTKIYPSEAAPVERDHKLIAVVPDIQFGYRHVGQVPYKITDGPKADYNAAEQYQPLHDPRAMHAAQMIMKDLRPDTIVLQGDLLDFSELSRYEADSPHFADTLQMSINGMHRYLAQLRADNPQAEMVGIAGNHEARLAKSILRHNAQTAGIKVANSPESWNVLSAPFLLRMGELGISWYGGYPANEFEYSHNLLFIHGQQTRSSGSTAALYSQKYPDTNVIFGHVHRFESHSRTDRRGNHLQSVTFGTLARIDGVVPSYGNGVDDHSQPVKRYENWQQGMGLVRVYDDGYIEMQPVRIKNGMARVGGVEYAEAATAR